MVVGWCCQKGWVSSKMLVMIERQGDVFSEQVLEMVHFVPLLTGVA